MAVTTNKRDVIYDTATTYGGQGGSTNTSPNTQATTYGGQSTTTPSTTPTTTPTTTPATTPTTTPSTTPTTTKTAPKDSLTQQNIDDYNAWRNGAATGTTTPAAVDAAIGKFVHNGNGSNDTTTPNGGYGGGGSGSSSSAAAAPAVRDDGTTWTNPTDAYYDDYLKAMQYLAQQGNEYNSPYGDAINNLVAGIMNRGSFNYNLNEDQLYQQYRDKYLGQARLSMMDTMGQASGLTGGYGSSYGQRVGQQAYDATLQNLNDVVPQLYSQAYGMWNDQGNEMRSNLSMMLNQDNTDYSRWMDSQNLARNDADTAWNKYLNERSYNDAQSDATLQRLLNLAAMGYTPTKAELAQAGVTEEQWAYYKKGVTPVARSSGGGGGGNNNNNDDTKTTDKDDYRIMAQALANGEITTQQMQSWLDATGYSVKGNSGLYTNNPNITDRRVGNSTNPMVWDAATQTWIPKK